MTAETKSACAKVCTEHKEADAVRIGRHRRTINHESPCDSDENGRQIRTCSHRGETMNKSKKKQVLIESEYQKTSRSKKRRRCEKRDRSPQGDKGIQKD